VVDTGDGGNGVTRGEPDGLGGENCALSNEEEVQMVIVEHAHPLEIQVG
jgi:hypothetical protein